MWVQTTIGQRTNQQYWHDFKETLNVPVLDARELFDFQIIYDK